MIVKGTQAQQLIEDLTDADQEEEQYLLARMTGNFKRGNERLAKQHPKHNPKI